MKTIPTQISITVDSQIVIPTDQWTEITHLSRVWWNSTQFDPMGPSTEDPAPYPLHHSTPWCCHNDTNTPTDSTSLAVVWHAEYPLHWYLQMFSKCHRCTNPSWTASCPWSLISRIFPFISVHNSWPTVHDPTPRWCGSSWVVSYGDLVGDMVVSLGVPWLEHGAQL